MGPDNQPQHLILKLTKSKLESLVQHLVERTLEPVKKALADSKLDKSEIKEILMVGGMTRMPLVQETVEKYFGKKINLTVNPDEVVALGAAVQGAVLKGDVKDILLLDVTPLSLSIETAGGVATPMIPRNTTIPTSKSQIFSTYADNQSAVDVHVVQGERPMAQDNKSLGKFTLSGIAPAPRGVPQIEVTFDLDANGILKVTALDKATAKSADITITGSSTMSEEEKKKAVEEAELQKEADEKKKAKVESHNNLESSIYQGDKLIKDSGDKLDSEHKKSFEALKVDGETVLKDEKSTTEIMEAKAKEITDLLMQMGEKLYANINTEAPAAEGADKGQDVEAKSSEEKPTEEPKKK